jgi:DNA-binding CsgD family transcriptional regulator/PAS domain-containing protein
MRDSLRFPAARRTSHLGVPAGTMAGTMDARDFSERLDELAEAVYDAALDPQGWGAVMGRMKTLFGSTAETFYLLDPGTSRMRDVHLAGIAPQWAACFDAAYFTHDNPWMRLSERLHQPGVVRTNERLIDHTRDREVLYRSQYFNEWMRPQDFRYTIGNTLLREPGLIANVTLLRPADMPTFDRREVRAFEQLSRHMTRALRFGMQFEHLADEREQALQTLERLPQAAVLVDPRGTILHANPAAEELLRRRDGLASRGGRLMAACAPDQQNLSTLISDAARPRAGDDAGRAPFTVTLQRAPAGAAGSPLTVSALPLPARRGGYRFAQRAVLVLASEAAALRPAAASLLRSHFALTAAEARLAHALASGDTLRAAASRAGIGYGTARGYLKLLFQKTGTHRQSDLLRCLLQIAPGA